MTQVPYVFPQLDAEIFSQVYEEIVLGFCGKLSRFPRKLPQNTYRGAGQLLLLCTMIRTRRVVYYKPSNKTSATLRKQTENFRFIFKRIVITVMIQVLTKVITKYRIKIKKMKNNHLLLDFLQISSIAFLSSLSVAILDSVLSAGN